MLAPILATLALGVLHALGPDHCVAVAALAARDARPRQVLALSVRFGLGHLTVFAAGWGALHLAGVTWPGWLDRAGEATAGAALVIIGLSLAGEGLLARLGIHAHGHAHDGVEHVHPHSHRRDGQHAHRHGSGLASGALFAVGGVRALLVGLPAAGAGWSTAALSLAAFGVGIVGTMSVYGLVLSRVLPALTSQRHARSGARVVGAIAAAVGLVVILNA